MIDHDEIKTKINEFNEQFYAFYDFNQLDFIPVENKQIIQTIAQHFKFAPPQELMEFYDTFGGISSSEEELLSINIPNPEQILEKLNEQDHCSKLYSLGIIDFIKYTWGQDRPEFDRIDQEKINHLNNNYQCIGYARHTWQYEEAHYFYFDQQGRFGQLRYHQDEFKQLWAEHLNTMLVSSLATDDLQTLIFETIDLFLEEIEEM